ncbi:MAG: MlrC C-terminal domain-containing protein, partial [Proteobacteria bacterium]|nr:MlrC C-terminal domain-containing protein [Pseudomonadota bacterium]
ASLARTRRFTAPVAPGVAPDSTLEGQTMTRGSLQPMVGLAPGLDAIKLFLVDDRRAGDARGVLLGIFFDPALAGEAHKRGQGASFDATFNAAGETEYSKKFEAPAKVLALSGGECVGRRGLWAGRALSLGPTALLDLDGRIKVVVVSNRKQCADPVFFEMFGLDIAGARTVVVKSRGHFRAGFDEFFDDGRVIEVDAPGLTSPVLTRFDFKNLPRPVFPLDPDAAWAGPEWD